MSFTKGRIYRINAHAIYKSEPRFAYGAVA